MGKVMGIAMSKLGGQADGKIVQKLVLKELTKWFYLLISVFFYL